jgi:hypothetical protein
MIVCRLRRISPCLVGLFTRAGVVGGVLSYLWPASPPVCSPRARLRAEPARKFGTLCFTCHDLPRLRAYNFGPEHDHWGPTRHAGSRAARSGHRGKRPTGSPRGRGAEGPRGRFGAACLRASFSNAPTAQCVRKCLIIFCPGKANMRLRRPAALQLRRRSQPLDIDYKGYPTIPVSENNLETEGDR